VSDTKDYFLISEDLEESVFCKWNGIDLPVGEYREDDDLLEDDEMQETVDRVFKEYSIKQFEIIYAFHGLLEAPGYMDQTDYYFGNSRAEVAEQLIDLFFFEDKEYMDKDELEDLEWLESIVNEGGGEDETT
jgi:hypothetical protein